jgi:hypothetical protein
MSSLFSSPSMPAPTVIQTPAPADPGVQQAATDQAAAQARAAGRAATILTSGQGDTSRAPVQRKTLLGQ